MGPRRLPTNTSIFVCPKDSFKVFSADDSIVLTFDIWLTLIGAGFILIACFLLITTPKENTTINIYSAVSFLAIGAGLITPTLRALISKKLDVNNQGSILSNLQGLQSLGGVLGIAMAGRVYDSFGPKSPFIAGSIILIFMIYLIAESKNNNSIYGQKPKVFLWRTRLIIL